MKEHSNHNDAPVRGQTLAEVVVVLSVIMLLVTGLVVGATASVRSAQYSRLKSQAAKYAQEAVEMVRTMRDRGWETLEPYGSPAGKTWCLDKAGTWTEAAGSCAVNIDGTFTREVRFTWADPTMTVEVSVRWGTIAANQSRITTSFTKRE